MTVSDASPPSRSSTSRTCFCAMRVLFPGVVVASIWTSSRSSKPTYSGRTSGKRIVSRMPRAPVSNCRRRSIPKPIPPVGDIPCSRARRKSSSRCIASGSPAAACSACSTNLARCTTGSTAPNSRCRARRRPRKNPTSRRHRHPYGAPAPAASVERKVPDERRRLQRVLEHLVSACWLVDNIKEVLWYDVEGELEPAPK